MRAAPALVAFVLMIAGAQAAPRSISDCESIKEADAYNRCLAEFGPAARTGGMTREVPAGADPAPRSPPEAPAVRQHGGRGKPAWLAARQAEGRRRMEERRRHRSGVTVERKGGRVRAIIDLKKR